MSDAPWKPAAMQFRWGRDDEGRIRGFTWCSLCGTSCEFGVIAEASPLDKKGSAFFCKQCCTEMYRETMGRDFS